MQGKYKYTVFFWCTDDESGNGIRTFEDFEVKQSNHYFETELPPLSYTEIKIGDFNTVRELATLLYNEDPELYGNLDNALTEANWLMKHYMAE